MTESKPDYTQYMILRALNDSQASMHGKSPGVIRWVMDSDFTQSQSFSDEDIRPMIQAGWLDWERQIYGSYVTVSTAGKKVLRKFRRLYDAVRPDMSLERAFKKHMKGRQFGEEERADAFEAFKAGWEAAHGDGSHAYIIRFDDADLPDESFHGITWDRIRDYYDRRSDQWNAHLYVKIDTNCSDGK